MDQDVAKAKLISMERCLARIASRMPATSDALASDLDAQDIVSVNLQRLVQLSVDLTLMIVSDRGLPPPADMVEGFQRLRDGGWLTDTTLHSMRSAVGFRNISVHEYRRLDWKIVFAICDTHLDDFRAFADELVTAGLIKL